MNRLFSAADNYFWSKLYQPAFSDLFSDGLFVLISDFFDMFNNDQIYQNRDHHGLKIIWHTDTKI